MDALLDGILVVDFSQFLAGPYASLRLLDMGARVIKVENPDGGDLCRNHYLSETDINGDSTIFHAINRGKESIALDLKTDDGLALALELATQADIVIENFRPGVMERLGLGYEEVRAVNPDVIYGSISGYGGDGEWAPMPGQDLLAQARSGIMWLSGNATDGPVPLGIPIADLSAGSNLAQGLLGALVRHGRTGQGALIETSLLEALIDLQFEFLTTYCNNGEIPPHRLKTGSAHGYIAAPYGVYATLHGYLAIAMCALPDLAQALEVPDLFASFTNPDAAFTARDEIYHLIERQLSKRSASDWEAKLAQNGIWCAKVMDWAEMLNSDAVEQLDTQSIVRIASEPEQTLFRTPIRVDRKRANARKIAPKLNANAREIRAEFDH